MKSSMRPVLQPESGSFRDPLNRVYSLASYAGEGNLRIFRGLRGDALEIFQSLTEENFYRMALESGLIVSTSLLNGDDENAATVMRDGWVGVLEHEPVPFVSYPYEWTFSMLKDGALLQLQLIEQSLENGWTLKDATPYNIQWHGARPVFIDVGSFEPWVAGEPWVGYRQFCSMFLIPLLLRAHLGIDHLPLLRSYIDGIPPTEAAKFFTGVKRFKKGVMSHIVFPAKVENSIAKRERDAAPAKERTARAQSTAMVVGLVQSLQRLVRGLSIAMDHTDWSQYDKTHSYLDEELKAKKAFVLKHASARRRSQIWDVGCNTGTFSRLVADHCDQVISVDGDHAAVERLYLAEKKHKSNILPLVMNLANISPSQGWNGDERKAFDQRGKPELVMCLALIHHTRISANIPNAMFLKWLRSLDSDIIIEFVNRDDDMVVKLLTNKKEKYEDYNIVQFKAEAEALFTIEDSQILKGGKREIFFLTPK